MPSQPENPPEPLGRINRRPAVLVALLLILGILLHDLFPHRLNWILILCALLASSAVVSMRRRVICAICLGMLVVLLGIAAAQREHFAFSAADIGLFATDGSRLTELEVRFIDDPTITVGSSMEQRQLPPRQVATVQVQRIKTWNGWVEATGQLPMQINEPNPTLKAGQIVSALGMLQRPRAAMNPGEFDWALYYRQQRILANFTVNRAGNLHLLASPGASPLVWLRAKAHHLLAMGFSSQHAGDCALLDALVLGNRDPELRDMQAEFKQTGMGYQLSVSGLHIAMLAWAFFWVCRAALFRPRVTLLLTTAFVMLYAAISLPSHSGTRAAIFCIILAISTCGGRFTDAWQLLSLAVIAMLLWHPMDLYSVGFHLSFAVAIAFLLLLPGLGQWVKSWRSPDDLAKPDAGRRDSMSQRLLSWISRCLQYGLVAWLATLPLVAYHFGQTSVWSVFGSLLLLPFVAMALFGGVAKVLLTMLWPRFADVFAAAAGSPVQAMRWGVHQLAKPPGSSVALVTPAVWLIVVYYLLLIAPVLPYWSLFSGRRRWALRLAPVIGVVVIFGASLRSHPAVGFNTLRVTLLSLGAGQCVVVEFPEGHAVLIDAGSTTVSDVAQKLVEPFLRADGDRHVDEIFLSHGDFDHISAAGEITAAYDVPLLLTSCHFRRNAPGNVPDQILLDELEKLNRSPKEIALGDHLGLSDGAAVDVLWPPRSGELNSNNAGLVLRLTFAGRSILFPADIQDPAFSGVLKNASALKSDVLVAPHHGSSEALTPAFLAAVGPQYILSSNFGRLTSKQKRFEKMIGHTPLYRTPECGAITVTIRSDGTMTVSTFLKGAQPKR